MPVVEATELSPDDLAFGGLPGMIGVMSEPVDILGLYLHLAQASEKRQRPHVRDRLLVVAAASAARMHLFRISKYCRRKILQHNPRHVIRHWENIAEALEDVDFLSLLRSIQRRYPLEKAERLLASLGIERGREREAYYDDEELIRDMSSGSGGPSLKRAWNVISVRAPCVTVTWREEKDRPSRVRMTL